MSTLDYVALARAYPTLSAESYAHHVALSLVTNFTDDYLAKLLIGMCLSEGIYPTLTVTPYKQYHFALADQASALYRESPAITFFLFDLNPYLESEFKSREHFDTVLAGIERLSQASPGIIVLSTFVLPVESKFGLKNEESELAERLKGMNARIAELAERSHNIYLLDVNDLVPGLGRAELRNMRNLYAFDMPFGEALLARIARKYLSYVRARLGLAKKCLVLDLDNVLWGGVLGEVGSAGIQLGDEYPGNAYKSFQRTLLALHVRGVILAVNSKNNLEDVMEVFEKNPHMLLKREHFAALYANWEDKSDNIVAIARDLNIDPSSMVFLDDDPYNRDLVRTRVSGVSVPEFSMPPEAHTEFLLSLDLFDSLSVSAEDSARNRMYLEEAARKRALESAQDPEKYRRSLGIEVSVSKNNPGTVPRVSQLTLKTNQFNLTTLRYTERDIMEHISAGSLVYTADVKDKFGSYGITNVAIVRFPEATSAVLDSYLMSCRVIGRGVEFTFLEHILKDMRELGIRSVTAHFIETPKNAPAKNFLSDAGFTEVGTEGEKRVFVMDNL